MASSRVDLLEGEEVLVDIRPHWTFLSAPLLVAAIAIGIGIGLDVDFPNTSVRLHWVEGVVVALPCLWLAVRWARWVGSGLVVTRFRIIEVWGVSSRHQHETRLADVASSRVDRGAFAKLVGSGSLQLFLYGGEVRTLTDVRRPVVLRRIVTRRLSPVGARGAGDVRGVPEYRGPSGFMRHPSGW